MGNIASGPVTYKTSGNGDSQQLGITWGYSDMQGWRDRMEDAHLAIASLGRTEMGHPGYPSAWDQTAVFAVMDGHGGEHVAHFCERYLPMEIAKGNPQDVGAALVNAFHRMDEMLADPANLGELQTMSNGMSFKSWHVHPETVGCTAVVCCVRNDGIVVANAGDSRAVLCRSGRAVNMSEDHKPNLPVESARIRRAGGSIVEHRCAGHTHYRVNGNLNLSRSIGDLLYKKNTKLSPQEQMISCHPDVRYFSRQAGDEFMVIACDGIWDVFSSQEAVDFIRSKLGDPNTAYQRVQDGQLRLSTIAEELLDSSLSPDLAQTLGLGGDNMTVVIVLFKQQQFSTKEPWLDSTGYGLVATPSCMCGFR